MIFNKNKIKVIKNYKQKKDKDFWIDIFKNISNDFNLNI